MRREVARRLDEDAKAKLRGLEARYREVLEKAAALAARQAALALEPPLPFERLAGDGRRSPTEDALQEHFRLGRERGPLLEEGVALEVEMAAVVLGVEPARLRRRMGRFARDPLSAADYLHHGLHEFWGVWVRAGEVAERPPDFASRVRQREARELEAARLEWRWKRHLKG